MPRLSLIVPVHWKLSSTPPVPLFPFHALSRLSLFHLHALAAGHLKKEVQVRLTKLTESQVVGSPDDTIYARLFPSFINILLYDSHTTDLSGISPLPWQPAYIVASGTEQNLLGILTRRQWTGAPRAVARDVSDARHGNFCVFGLEPDPGWQAL